jgi:hypothetical protein
MSAGLTRSRSAIDHQAGPCQQDISLYVVIQWSDGKNRGDFCPYYDINSRKNPAVVTFSWNNLLGGLGGLMTNYRYTAPLDEAR